VRKAVLFLIALALITAGCGGGGSSCADIADDGLALFQDAINELDGLDLADIQDDPFETDDFERRSEDLDKRTTEAGCTDQELSELFTERIGDLSAGSSNPAGQFLISLLTTAAENGELDFSG
jgi:hypothetical protein